MAILTEERWKHLGKMGQGLIPGKTPVCDWCTGVIGSIHFVTLEGKDACTQECRELLEHEVIANRKSKKSKKETSMKKDEAKKGKKDEEKKKKKDEEVEEDADVKEPDEDDDEADAGEEGPPEDEDEDEKPKKSKKDDEDDDEEEEKKSSKKSKKKKDDEDGDEDDDTEKKKGKKAKTAGKKPIKKPYVYRKGTVIRKIFDRLRDGKNHVKAELFKGLSGVEQPFSRLKIHADRFGWDWTEKGDQVKLVIPKGKGPKMDEEE